MMDELLEKVESQMDCRSEVEVAKVTGKVVQQAVLRMKPGKVDVSTGYSSDSLLHGPPILFEKLAAVFRSFLPSWPAPSCLSLSQQEKIPLNLTPTEQLLAPVKC